MGEIQIYTHMRDRYRVEVESEMGLRTMGIMLSINPLPYILVETRFVSESTAVSNVISLRTVVSCYLELF